MKSATGRWVIGDDFFNRSQELKLLEARVLDGNHILLTGQRRMGKTSLAQELGRRLKANNWDCFFTDVEDAKTPEDVIAEIAEEIHPVKSITSRLVQSMGKLFDKIEEISAADFRVKIRAGLNAGTWRRIGEDLLKQCADHEKPVLLVIDELPIFLNRISQHDNGIERVDEFLSWFRRALNQHIDGGLVVIVSGSIGLRPMVERLGLTDRINYLDTYRVGPWCREESIACFTQLANTYHLQLEGNVAELVYDTLGIGIPHHVQSFFARLKDNAIMQRTQIITAADVDNVYQNSLLGPSGQNDLVHYETRLQEGLEEQTYSLAMEILAEAAIHDVFTPEASRCLNTLYAEIMTESRQRITDALEVLVHDGYLERIDAGYQFPSRLLKDWWAAKFRNHYEQLCTRVT